MHRLEKERFYAFVTIAVRFPHGPRLEARFHPLEPFSALRTFVAACLTELASDRSFDLLVRSSTSRLVTPDDSQVSDDCAKKRKQREEEMKDEEAG